MKPVRSKDKELMKKIRSYVDEYELEKSEPARAVVDEENSEYGVKDDGGKISFVREQLLMIVQLGICIAVVSGALILKAVGGEVYANTATSVRDSPNSSNIQLCIEK